MSREVYGHTVTRRDIRFSIVNTSGVTYSMPVTRVANKTDVTFLLSTRWLSRENVPFLESLLSIRKCSDR